MFASFLLTFPNVLPLIFFPLLPHLTALSPFQPQCISEVDLCNTRNFCLVWGYFLGKTYDDLSFSLCCKLEVLPHLAGVEAGGWEEGIAAWCPRVARAGGSDTGDSHAPLATHRSRLLQGCGGPITQGSCAHCPPAL